MGEEFLPSPTAVTGRDASRQNSVEQRPERQSCRGDARSSLLSSPSSHRVTEADLRQLFNENATHGPGRRDPEGGERAARARERIGDVAEKSDEHVIDGVGGEDVRQPSADAMRRIVDSRD